MSPQAMWNDRVQFEGNGPRQELRDHVLLPRSVSCLSVSHAASASVDNHSCYYYYITIIIIIAITIIIITYCYYHDYYEGL